MHIAVSEAKAQLTELVRRAEAGDEIILTRHGHPAARLVPIRPTLDKARKQAIMEEIQAECVAHMRSGPDAAHSQDFLYDEDGLPA